MIKIKNLENTGVEEIHRAFLDAFSDYDVPMNPNLDSFEKMLKRRSYSSKLSYGAFVDGSLVGLILNGEGLWNHQKTLYDLGTGVSPMYRRQGITKALFSEVLSNMKIENVNQYLLEVLVTNERAINLYKNEGFKITRTLKCYRLNVDNFEVYHDKEIRTSSDLNILELFSNFFPSWQNSMVAIRNVLVDMKIVSIVKDNEILAYGVVDVKSGDVAQIAIKEGYNYKEYLQILLYELSKHTSSNSLTLLNIDSNHKESNETLKYIGFENIADQYEMILDTKICS